MVVEDEFIVALDLSETVREMGYAVDGPYAYTDHAIMAVHEEMPDFAILDVQTGDGEVFPLADALSAAGVPIIFHSGCTPPAEVARRYPRAQAVSKPCPPDQLIAMMTRANAEAA
ncbi:response regulator [Aurantiacibacter spongiae]|uniref:Response regulator n=1 Tax=Aurantiacibacter spongiae TaxID=2488860 RepID=A0A3N5CVM4_9SPHN|nr:response regulator [Aurantiacibacter spongiae]